MKQKGKTKNKSREDWKSDGEFSRKENINACMHVYIEREREKKQVRREKSYKLFNKELNKNNCEGNPKPLIDYIHPKVQK